MSLPSSDGLKAIEANSSIFTAAERVIVDRLVANDQSHLFAHWPAPGEKDDEKHKFLAQIAQIEHDYIGGVTGYVKRAKELLAFAVKGGNPYEGYEVSVPQNGVRLETPEDFNKFEGVGLDAVHTAAFVIVAGGLGERLGYRGIKLALPSESLTQICFIELYCRFILSMQTRARKLTGNATLELPLAIMTSDDTDAATRQLLSEHQNFGLNGANQLIVFKQGKVPSLLDNDAHFCLEEKDPYTLDTKPHGHGDVHMLLYKNAIVEKWVKQQNRKWLVFFQDTNGLVFRAITAALGVSVANSLDMNTVSVPRVQGDAMGAICTLKREKAPESKDVEQLPNEMTINVEYNQLEGLLGKGVKEPQLTGSPYSVYPGNTNVLIFNAPKYFHVLEEKKGIINEFVNPKYNPDKKSFKKPTRLESMMQDIPKLFDSTFRVSFSQFQRWTSFSSVKNAIADGIEKQKGANSADVAATGEQDMYTWYNRILAQAGVKLPEPVRQVYRGIRVDLPTKIVFSPSFAVSQAELKSKFPTPDAVSISNSNSRTAFVIDGQDVTVKALKLDGALVIRAAAGAEVVVDGLSVENAGWEFEEITDDRMSSVEAKWQVRGWTVKKNGGDVFEFTQPGKYTLSDATKEQFRKK